MAFRSYKFDILLVVNISLRLNIIFGSKSFICIFPCKRLFSWDTLRWAENAATISWLWICANKKLFHGKSRKRISAQCFEVALRKKTKSRSYFTFQVIDLFCFFLVTQMCLSLMFENCFRNWRLESFLFAMSWLFATRINEQPNNRLFD